jgi:thiol-disulfide isomerase/thioredoxin
MRIRLRFGLLLACLFAMSAWAQAPTRALPWQGKGADGQVIHFDPQHLQRPALLFFWATWCPYCEAMAPYLQKVYDAAGRDKLDVYAIDFHDEDGHPAATLRARGQTFTLVRNGDAIADAYGVQGTPGLFLIDAKGDIVYQLSGGGEPDKVEAHLRRLLHLPPAMANANPQ